MAAGIAGVPPLPANKGAKEFIRHQESWWNQCTDCVNFSKRAQQADVASSSRCRLMVSVSVCSCFGHFLSHPYIQTQQQQQQHHHLAESASDTAEHSRAEQQGSNR